MAYDVSDNELIYLFRNNNYDAFVELSNRYRPRIFGLIDKIKVRFGISSLDYQDYYQTCYLAFIKCIGMFDDEYIFYNYFIQAIENVLVRELAKEKQHKSIVCVDQDLINEGYPFGDTINDSSYLYEENEIKNFINDNFDDLSIKIIEYKLKGYNSREIKDLLNINSKTVYNRVNKIRKTINSDISLDII